MTTQDIVAPVSALRDVGLHEQITAIRDNSGELYAIDKLEAHISNIRHMAVSIFVFDGDHLLLQRRAKTKYHSAGLWANTVCSHPRWNESIEDCAVRRLSEELGWTVPLHPVGSIDYCTRVGELYENENVHCFHGQHNPDNDLGAFNALEVDAVEWHTIPEILKQISQRPQVFSEWFKIYMSRHLSMFDPLVA